MCTAFGTGTFPTQAAPMGASRQACQPLASVRPWLCVSGMGVFQEQGSGAGTTWGHRGLCQAWEGHPELQDTGTACAQAHLAGGPGVSFLVACGPAAQPPQRSRLTAEWPGTQGTQGSERPRLPCRSEEAGGRRRGRSIPEGAAAGSPTERAGQQPDRALPRRAESAAGTCGRGPSGRPAVLPRPWPLCTRGLCVHAHRGLGSPAPASPGGCWGSLGR